MKALFCLQPRGLDRNLDEVGHDVKSDGFVIARATGELLGRIVERGGKRLFEYRGASSCTIELPGWDLYKRYWFAIDQRSAADQVAVAYRQGGYRLGYDTER